jgi:hypothetical protein
MKPTDESKLEELLAGFVMGESNETEFRELPEYSETNANLTLDELERIASTISLAGVDQIEELPPALRSSISDAGRSFVSEATSNSETPIVRTVAAQTIRLREVIAWISCLAASLLAVYFGQSQLNQGDRQGPAAITRDSLIASSPDLVQTRWETARIMKGKAVSGDIVWSDTLQSGFMRFVGMPVNEPSISQYQLWIYDPSRDSEPIDGGVFDITSTKETIVAIQAKLRVSQPVAFAVTIEKPGGVVVSDQKRLSLLAFVQ